MPMRASFGSVAALVLEIFTLFPYFLLVGEASSRLMIWVKLIIYAALLFSPVRLLGQPKFRLVLVFCLPVAAISLILGFAEPPNLLGALRAITEPILCVWLGASLAWIVLHVGRLHW